MELVTSTNIYFERRHERPVDTEQCLRLCAGAGFKKMDFGFAEHVLVSEKFRTDRWEEEIRGYRDLAETLGLSFAQAHASILDFCNPGEDFAEKEELFKRSLLGAKMLGAPWIVVHPSTKVKNGCADPETHAENVHFFRKYSRIADEIGIGIAIENMWGKTREGVRNYAVDPEELFQLIEDVDCENVRVCWDVEHGSIENLDQPGAIRLLGKYIVATHISDESGADNIHILPYLGRMDWEEIFRAFARVDYNGTFDLEIQHFLPGVPEQLIPTAMKLAYETGMYMTARIEKLKQEMKETGR